MNIFEYASRVCKYLNAQLDDQIAKEKVGVTPPEKLTIGITMDPHIARAVEIVLAKSGEKSGKKMDWEISTRTGAEYIDFTLNTAQHNLEELRHIDLGKYFKQIESDIQKATDLGKEHKFTEQFRNPVASVKSSDLEVLDMQSLSELIRCLAKANQLIEDKGFSLSEGKGDLSLKISRGNMDKLLQATGHKAEVIYVDCVDRDGWRPEDEPLWADNGEHLRWLTDEYYKYKGSITGEHAKRIHEARERYAHSENILGV